MISVEIISDSKFPVDRKKIREAVAEVLMEQRIDVDVELCVLVVGTRKMTVLNEKHMKRSGPTDVLSFPLQDPSDNRPFIVAPDGVLRLGDIVVCYPVAMEQAITSQILVDQAVCDLVKHGTLHLLGIHHD